MSHRHWHRANNLLFLAILLINSYVIAAPFLPRLEFWWQQHHNKTQQTLTERITHPSKPTPQSSNTPQPTVFQADASHDGLIIPKMLLDTPLIEGPMRNSFSLLNQGAWRLPIANTPNKPGNTVIAGHRFSYTGPRGVFYFLDKLAPGDDIGLWYQGTLYRYRVESTRTHKATDVAVQDPGGETRLTLYTCTPLWNPIDRLVVVAKPLDNKEVP